jgi:hypothetical protein
MEIEHGNQGNGAERIQAASAGLRFTGGRDKKGVPVQFLNAGTPFGCAVGLQGLYVFCSRALLALRDIKAHALAFLERLETAALDGAEVNEEIAALILLDEAEAFLLVEPFDFTF